jgi:hypothetical protein
MRLINIKDLDNLRIAGPFWGDNIPPYAILSHTWGKDELSFQDMMNFSQHSHKRGFQKILSFCKLARAAKYEYAWVDTVCIDKTSSAEPSEAINSMYRWYSKSAVCYAVLEDLHSNNAPPSLLDLKACRWFTRGWTLQELLAPERVVFYNANWIEIGVKADLAPVIAHATGIDPNTVAGFYPVQRSSIARRMSWASQRKTSRPEDLAYCLLGIFDINMSMLYGEGEKAFVRLQEEIIRKSDDHSIFAWSADPAYGRTRSGYWSLLAPSPIYFKSSQNIIPVQERETGFEPTITSRGICLNVLANLAGSQIILRCRPADRPLFCTIPIASLRSRPDDYARFDEPWVPGLAPFPEVENFSKPMPLFVKNNIHSEDFEHSNLISYIELTQFPNEESGYDLVDWFPGWSYDMESKRILASPFPDRFCGAILYFEDSTNINPPFVVALYERRSSQDTSSSTEDIVGVYNRLSVSLQDFASNFMDWLRNNQQGELSGGVELEICNGIEAWKLNEDNYVRISIKRGRMYGYNRRDGP